MGNSCDFIVTSLCQTSCFPKRAALTSLAELTVSVIFTGNHESRDALCVLSCISNSIAWLLSALRGTLCWSLFEALSGSEVPSTTSRKYPAIYPLITNTHLSLCYRAHISNSQLWPTSSDPHVLQAIHFYLRIPLFSSSNARLIRLSPT